MDRRYDPDSDDDARSISFPVNTTLEPSEAEFPITTTSQTPSEIGPFDSVSIRVVAERLMEEVHRRATSNTSVEPSIISLRSSTHDYLYKVIHGRAFSSASDIYVLPADDDEHSRLDMQHFALCLSMSSLYPFKTLIENVLRQGEGSPPEIIDVGTGSGRWAVDMAVAFPWANVTGIDLVPPALLDKADIPDNCRFEIDDANLSMAHYEGSLSLIHARAVHVGLNDVENFMYEAARALKPGGVFVIGAGSSQFCDENRQRLRADLQPDDPNFTWTQFIGGQVYRAYIHRGSWGVNSQLYWKKWAENNPNFSDVYFEEIYIPMGPWKENMTDQERFNSNLMQEAIARAYVNFKQAFLIDGHDEATIDHWIEESTKEMRDGQKRIYHRFAFVGAVRNDAPWQERLERVELEEEKTRSVIAGIDLEELLADPRQSGTTSA